MANTALARLDEIAKLEPNWDSYGADTPWPEAIRAARELVRLFAHPPNVVPRSGGGVQLEWHREGWEIELAIENVGTLDVANDVLIERRPLSTGCSYEGTPEERQRREDEAIVDGLVGFPIFENREAAERYFAAVKRLSGESHTTPAEGRSDSTETT